MDQTYAQRSSFVTPCVVQSWPRVEVIRRGAFGLSPTRRPTSNTPSPSFNVVDDILPCRVVDLVIQPCLGLPTDRNLTHSSTLCSLYVDPLHTLHLLYLYRPRQHPIGKSIQPISSCQPPFPCLLQIQAPHRMRILLAFKRKCDRWRCNEKRIDD